MTKNTDIAIIGAGTAGLSALSEVKKAGKDFLLIDHGPIGTTCARVGCMPSKVLIQCANEFHRRHHLANFGISGSDQLSIDLAKVFHHVRTMRDHFTSGVIESTRANGEYFIQGYAQFRSPNELIVDDQVIRAKKIILATGTKPIVPEAWSNFEDRILTSDNLFEQEDLPSDLSVIGAGLIGLEFSQACARLGITISQFHSHPIVGGLTDPDINQDAINIFSKEWNLHLNQRANVQSHDKELITEASKIRVTTPKIIAALGRRTQNFDLNLECLNVPLDDNGIPEFNPDTMQVGNTPVFIAGDATKTRPQLHEAANEGRIAGYNASQDTPASFQRATPLTIIFTDPNIAQVGKRFTELDKQKIVIGSVDFSDQGRSKIMRVNQGRLNVYADAHSGCLLGSEMIAPSGEHLAHILSWAIQQKMTVYDALNMPFYHPVIEEGLRSALRDAASKLTS